VARSSEVSVPRLTRAERPVMYRQLDLPCVTCLCCHGDTRVPFTVLMKTKESFL
jgi:hypothetical protein